MAELSSLVSGENLIESPFIIVTIGNYTFGYASDMSSKQRLSSKVTFPELVQSLNITKVNGTVNQYSIVLEYGITEVDDPNLIENVFSSVSDTRRLKISYGDWEMPSYIYKEEEALITKVRSNTNFSESKIVYTVSCVSTCLSLLAGTKSFNKRKAKPSDVLKELLNDVTTGLQSVFTGMTNKTKNAANSLIAGDDKVVEIEAKQSISPLDYLNYLVTCMESVTNTNSSIKDSNYMLAVYDDTTNEYGGSYFKVQKVTAGTSSDSTYSTYEVDVGFPSPSNVTNFSIVNDDTWSILYKSSSDMKLPEYSYSIDRHGEMITSASSSVTSSSRYLKTTASDKTWWTKMTQFPITAKLELKGLMRPTILMSYVKVNAYFYGHKHVSSGFYIITKHEDVINSSGYKTTLTLLRVAGDD